MTQIIIYFIHMFFYTSSAEGPTDSELLEWYNAHSRTPIAEIETLQSAIKGTRFVITGKDEKPLTFEKDWPFIERILQFQPRSWDPHCYVNSQFFIPEKSDENPILLDGIKSIDASSCNITEQNISWFKRFSDLTALNIDAHKKHTFSGKGILELAKHLPKWVSLCAWDNPNLSVEGVTEIAKAGFQSLNLNRLTLCKEITKHDRFTL